MSGTTNLSELPNQQPKDNVVLSIQEKNQVQQQFIPDSQPNSVPPNQVIYQPPQQQQAPPPQLVPQNPANLQNRDIYSLVDSYGVCKYPRKFSRLPNNAIYKKNSIMPRTI